jgi:beta-propeller repeat-containing protein
MRNKTLIHGQIISLECIILTIILLLPSLHASFFPLVRGSSNFWMRTWGGSLYDSWGEGVAADALGNIYVSGVTGSFNAPNFLLKYNTTGSLLWQRVWGSFTDSELPLQFTHRVEVDNDGNVFAIGRATGANYFRTVVIKLDSNATLIWARSVGNQSTRYSAQDLAVDSFGNVYVTGIMCLPTPYSPASSNHIFLFKLNSTGNLLWQQVWGTVLDDEVRAIFADNAGNVYVTGQTRAMAYDYFMGSMFLLKFDSGGNLLFQDEWGNNTGETYDLAGDSNGSVYVTGYTITGIHRDAWGNITDYNYNAAILKFNSSGTLEWQKAWGGARDDYGFAISTVLSGRIYVTGFEDSFAPHSVFLLELDPHGNLLDQRTWGGNSGYDISISPEGEPLVVGRVVTPPPYDAQRPNGELRPTNFTMRSSNFTSISQSVNITSPTITMSTPQGRVTFAGDMGEVDAFLSKGIPTPSSNLFTPETLPYFIVITGLSLTGAFAFFLRLKRQRLHRFP